MFRDRARHVKEDWDITVENAPLVAEILEMTDGIPLAIELVAARIAERSLGDIRDGLRDSRLALLNRDPFTSRDPRHASMKACIEWSVSLLYEPERSLFEKLAVFRGGFFADDIF